MNTTGTPRAVIDFARAVRARLSDLPEAEVEDLTEGLEADLSERMADDGPELGDPVGYADELRHAAGLAPRVTKVPGPEPGWKRQADAAAGGYAQLIAAVRSTPAGDSAMDLLASLRPVWWVVRGWVGYRVIATVFGAAGSVTPRSAFGWLMLAALVVISVQWGRDRWLPTTWLRGLRWFANALAIVLLLPVLSYWSHTGPVQVMEGSGYSYSPGITHEGNTVTNVFAYDCSGAQVSNIQLFDQEGRPLNAAAPQDEYISDYSSTGADHLLFPSRFVSGEGGWNVFPLPTATDTGSNGGAEGSASPALNAAVPPFASVQPLMDECREKVPGGETAVTAPPPESSAPEATGSPGKAVPPESAKPSTPAKSTGKGQPTETRAPAGAALPTATPTAPSTADQQPELPDAVGK